MLISEAIKVAAECSGVIRREKWDENGGCSSITPDNPTCWLNVEREGYPPVPGWEPGADDLTADDWYVVKEGGQNEP